MAEFKRNFTAGRMNKDLDERLLPFGEYREALNVQVSTSEESDIGSVQNILGNKKLFDILENTIFDTTNSSKYRCVGVVADGKNDCIYYFIAGPVTNETSPIDNFVYGDFIIELNTLTDVITPVVVDIHTIIATTELSAPGNTIGTSLNINSNEGVKVGMLITMNVDGQKITREITNITQTGSVYEITWNDNVSGILDDIYVEFNQKFGRVLNFSGRAQSNHQEPIITGINIIDDLLFWTDNYYEPKKINITRCKAGTNLDFSSHTELIVNNTPTGDLLNYKHITLIKKSPPLPVNLILNIDERAASGSSTDSATVDFTDPGSQGSQNLTSGNEIVFQTVGNPDYRKGDVLILDLDTSDEDPFQVRIRVKEVVLINPQLEITGIIENIDANLNVGVADFTVSLELERSFFELKFPKFSYRYKYEDGEYSSMAPFSKVAFVPGGFEYKHGAQEGFNNPGLKNIGYNLGMTNILQELTIIDFVLKDTPDDVVSVDILYKESNSPNVYTVKTIKKEDAEWNLPGTGSHKGVLKITKEIFNASLPSNQLTRLWDNVPRKALAQEVTGNRLVFANYLQNYNLKEGSFDVSNAAFNFTISSSTLPEENSTFLGQESIKSLRNYQLGIVYRDEFGRETPVVTHETATLKLSKSVAIFRNRLQAAMLSSPPTWADSYKYFVKETSGEYYNLSLDRWYDAGDGTMWLSFPSEDRNKIDNDTVLILKKQHDSNVFTYQDHRYKVLAIENEAPEITKTTKRIYGKFRDNVGNNGLGIVKVPISETNEIVIMAQDWEKSKLHEAKNIRKSNSKYSAVSSTRDNLVVRVGLQPDANNPALDYLSAWYDVASINLESENSAAASTITIKTDVNFENSDVLSSVGSATQPADGIIVEIAEKVIESKPEHQGRFFVKILSGYEIRKELEEAEANSLYSTDLSWGITYFNGKPNSSLQGTKEPSYISSGATNFMSDAQYGYVNFNQVQPQNSSSVDLGVLFNDTNSALGAGLNPNYSGYWAGPFTYGQSPGFTGRDYYARGEDAWNTILGVFDTPSQSVGANGCSGKECFFIDAEPTFAKISSGVVGARLPYALQPGSSLLYVAPVGFENRPGKGAEPGSNEMSIGFIGHLEDDFIPGSPSPIKPSVYSIQGNLSSNNSYIDNYPVSYLSNNTPNLNVIGVNDIPRRRNPIYQSFVDKLNTIGQKFKFTEDPNSTIYTITGVNTTKWWRATTIHNARFTNGENVPGAMPSCRWDLTLDRRLGYLEDQDTGTISYDGYVPTYHTATSGTYFDAYNTATGFTSARTELNVVNGPYARHAWYDSDNSQAYFTGIEFISPGGTTGGGSVRRTKSNNPAIFETEPKELPELDIYYEASKAYPVVLTEENAENYIRINDVATCSTAIEWNKSGVKVVDVKGQGGSDIFIPNTPYGLIKETIIEVNEDPCTNNNLPVGSKITFSNVDGTAVSALFQNYYNPVTNTNYTPINPPPVGEGKYLAISSITIGNGSEQMLNWSNCYSFGNGVESDRIRDLFNDVKLEKGAKASTTLDQPYKEERRKSSLIFSEIYNSTSGTNDTNQFLIAENITKDLNPTYGSIQRLWSQATAEGNLIAMCEDRILNIQANKDALFNADGSSNVVATNRVLGVAVPYAGNFGISKNPESFAYDSYRGYFTDKQRGAVLRLSRDGLTEISRIGMSDFFKDEFELSSKLEQDKPTYIGSFDHRKKLYNLTLTSALKPNPRSNEVLYTPKTISFSESVKGWTSLKSFIPEQGISVNNKYYTFNLGNPYQHHVEEYIGKAGETIKIPRNNFYDVQYNSSLKLIINNEAGIIKNFNNVNYEGSQSLVNFNDQDNEYYNNADVSGWYLNELKTDLQDTGAIYFKNKEGKWFSQIKGKEEAFKKTASGTDTNMDTKEFSTQGIDFIESIQEVPDNYTIT
tara:strand:+ start:476 stop:6217 length:5742 start_codon:yes stop_codon:yes gene_type:complete